MSYVYFLQPDRAKNLPDAMNEAGIDKVISKSDFVAVKIHFGEKGNMGHVRPESIKPVIKKIKDLGAHPFLTDANTIYRGERTDAIHHLMVAAEHNFHPKFLGAPVVIADGLRGTSYVEVDIGGPTLRLSSGHALVGKEPSPPLAEKRGIQHPSGPKHFKKVKIAEAIYYSDAIISVAHFKGHILCGFGGAIKNIGMGCASRAGKYEQHNSVVPKVDTANCTACGACVKWCSGGALTLVDRDSGLVIRDPSGERTTNHEPRTTIRLDPAKCVGCGQCILACNFKVFSIPWSEGPTVVQEKIAEYAYGVLKNKRAFYINFLMFITQHCDCFKTTAKPVMPDIGILVSTDPVAIDQASLDLVKKHAGHDILKEVTGVNGVHQLDYAERLGLGTREYELK